MNHEWKEATCTEPKACSKCGKTEGSALEHTLTQANYQQPAKYATKRCRQILINIILHM
ncbi:MAG: hypothetical protein HFI60_09060 [Lachnospiraceae bacterium]|nr:hypothetical protein [Lachnospiraceae bacterium]